MEKKVVKDIESKKKEVLVWRKKEVNKESEPSVVESGASTSSYKN